MTSAKVADNAGKRLVIHRGPCGCLGHQQVREKLERHRRHLGRAVGNHVLEGTRGQLPVLFGEEHHGGKAAAHGG
jgi:hypothetical protein